MTSRSEVFRYDIYEAAINRDGLMTYVNKGVPVLFNGDPMVQLAHGTIVDSEGWHADLGSAKRAAADYIEQLGTRLMEQAAKLRADANGAT
jgi:hypothetical protein